MPARVINKLDPYKSQLTEKVLAGEKTKDILAFLAENGIKCSEAVLKRKLKEWREVKALPPVKDTMQNKELETAALAYIKSCRHFPTDLETVEAMKAKGFNVGRRSVRHLRMRHGLRRRIFPTRFNSSEDLVAAVILRLSGDIDSRPFDDELAEELNNAGFKTSAKEIYAIRLKNKIKHPMRGANKRGRFRRLTQQHDTAQQDGENEGSDADAETEPESEPPPPEPPKLVQQNVTNVINLDADALAMIQQVTPSLLKVKFDRLKAHPGVHFARLTPKFYEIVHPLVENLLQSAPPHNMQVTAIYISNNMFLPDPLFGCWLIPLEFHRVKEVHVDESSDESDGETEVNKEHWIDDIDVKIGMALYVGKAVAVHCRMTALVLSR